jgi:hypothetical protein
MSTAKLTRADIRIQTSSVAPWPAIGRVAEAVLVEFERLRTGGRVVVDGYVT